MISTNKIQPKREEKTEKELKLNIVTTNKIKPKEFPKDFDFPEYEGYEPAERNDLSKLGMITTGNYKEKLAPFLNPKKKAGRPKKEEGENVEKS
ncbi:MAG: hypothetical protein ACFFBD_10140 [Candidatus Hodarchaeota archaeon]